MSAPLYAHNRLFSISLRRAWKMIVKNEKPEKWYRFSWLFRIHNLENRHFLCLMSCRYVITAKNKKLFLSRQLFLFQQREIRSYFYLMTSVFRINKFKYIPAVREFFYFWKRYLTYLTRKKYHSTLLCAKNNAV